MKQLEIIDLIIFENRYRRPDEIKKSKEREIN